MPNGDAYEQQVRDAQQRVLEQRAEGHDVVIATLSCGLQRNREAVIATLNALPCAIATELREPPSDWRGKAAKVGPPAAACGGFIALLWAIAEIVRAAQGG